MENPQPKWQWPAKRFDQAVLVLDALFVLVWVFYVLGGQLFGGKRLPCPQPELWITIAAVVVALVAGTLATQNRSWRTLGTFLFWWAMASKYIAGHVAVERRFFLEVLVILAYGATALVWGISILRGEWNKKSPIVEVDNHEDGNRYA